MPKPAKKNHKFTFAATVLPCQLEEEKDIVGLFSVGASYQVVPSTTNCLIYDAEKYLKILLPLSKHQVIDVCLPFSTKKGISSLCRYIIFEQKILAIRMPASSSQPERTLQQHYLGDSLMECMKIEDEHKKSGKNQRKSVPCGQFYLVFNSFKVAPLFLTEVWKNFNIMEEYYRLGCQVFAIMNDMPLRKLSHEEETRITTKIKQFAKNKYVGIIYYGLVTAYSPNDVYYTSSFAQQGAKIQYPKQKQFTFYQVFSITVDISLIHRQKIQEKINLRPQQLAENRLMVAKNAVDSIQVVGEVQHADFEGHLLEEKINSHQAQFFNQYFAKSLKLWCLYNCVNHKEPFTVRCPLSPQTRELVTILEYISEVTSIPLRLFLHVYKHSPLSLVEEVLKSVTVYDSLQELISGLSGRQIYLYSEGEENLQGMIQCQELISELSGYQGISKDQNICDPQNKALSKEIGSKHWAGLEQIIDYLSSMSVCDADKIQIIGQHLPRIYRSSLKLMPFCLYLIKQPKQQIKKRLKECISKLSSKQFKELQPNQTTEISQKIKQIKQNQKNIKKSKPYPKCHKCCLRLKKELLKQCEKCGQWLCLRCIDQTESLQNYSTKNCIICRKECKCERCIERMTRKLSPVMGEKKGKGEKNVFECNICLIFGRPKKRIKVACRLCSVLACYSCMINSTQKSKDYKEWLCSNCSNKQMLKIKGAPQRKQKQDQAIQVELLHQDNPKAAIEKQVIGKASNSETAEQHPLIHRKQQKQMNQSFQSSIASSDNSELSSDNSESASDDSRQSFSSSYSSSASFASSLSKKNSGWGSQDKGQAFKRDARNVKVKQKEKQYSTKVQWKAKNTNWKGKGQEKSIQRMQSKQQKNFVIPINPQAQEADWEY